MQKMIPPITHNCYCMHAIIQFFNHGINIFTQNITDWHLGIFVTVVILIVVVLLVIGYSIPATLPSAFTTAKMERTVTHEMYADHNYITVIITQIMW